MKNQTIKNTIGLMAFVMLIVATHNVSAYALGAWDNDPRIVDQTNNNRNVYRSNDVAMGNTGFTTYDQNDYATGNGMTISDETQSNNNSSTKKATTTKTTTISNTKNVTNNNTSESTVSDDSKVLQPVSTIDDTNNFGASASNSGFMPSTFWGWLLIIFLILIAIILLRLATRPKQTGTHSAH